MTVVRAASKVAAGSVVLITCLLGLLSGCDDEVCAPVPFEIQGLTADGVAHCVVVPDLRASWVSQQVEPGSHTLRLVSSSFGAGPAAGSPMVCVLLGGLAPSSYDRWFFTLNGVGDSCSAEFTSGGVVYLGFADVTPDNNHGQSVVSVGGTDVVVDGILNCTEVPELYSGLLPAATALPGGTYRLVLRESDFESSPGGQNRFVLLAFGHLLPTSQDAWLTTLNGSGDSVDVTLGTGGHIWAGFLDTGSSDNAGGTTFSIRAMGS